MKATRSNSDLLLFDDALPKTDLDSAAGFRSQCIADRKVKVEDLFRFRRGRGDLQISFLVLLLALFFFVFFFSHTGWQNRKLPDEMGQYIAHQLGVATIDGRVTRLGRVLKQSWVIPMLCLLLLVPTAIWNFRESWKVHCWRKRFLLPTSAAYEFSQYLSALEFVFYFIGYTLAVPVLGYLLSTVLLGSYLTFRLGYRTPMWLLRGFGLSLVIVLLFRSLLQIKTPTNIWLYDQLPPAVRAFMLTYF